MQLSTFVNKLHLFCQCLVGKMSGSPLLISYKYILIEKFIWHIKYVSELQAKAKTDPLKPNPTMTKAWNPLNHSFRFTGECEAAGVIQFQSILFLRFHDFCNRQENEALSFVNS